MKRSDVAMHVAAGLGPGSYLRKLGAADVD